MKYLVKLAMLSFMAKDTNKKAALIIYDRGEKVLHCYRKK